MCSPLIITRPDILHQLLLMRCAVYSDLYYRVRAYEFADSQPLQIHLSCFGHAMFAQKAKDMSHGFQCSFRAPYLINDSTRVY